MGLRDLVLLVLVYICIGLLVFWYCKPAQPAIPDNALVVTYLDDGIKVYKFKDGFNTCYVGVGKTYGYAVAISCIEDVERECYD